MTSRHYVTTLNAAYLQLKWFTAAGCVFVGHGTRPLARRVPLSSTELCGSWLQG